MTTQDPPEQAPPPDRHVTPPPRPGRPDVGADSAALGADQHAVPDQVTTSCWLWIVGFLAGLAAAVVALTRLDELEAELKLTLQDVVTSRQLSITPEQLDSVVEAVLLATLAAIVVLIVLQVLLVALLRARRGWARGLLMVTVLLSAPVLFVAQDLVTGQARLGFLLQAVLMVLGAILMYVPDSNAWYRRRHTP